MNEVYLLTGGNMGDREAFLEKAAKAIEEMCGTVLTRSSIYETAAWGKQDQEPFLNQVLMIRTRLEPLQSLELVRYSSLPSIQTSSISVLLSRQ